jgi:hypothetical protein
VQQVTSSTRLNHQTGPIWRQQNRPHPYARTHARTHAPLGAAHQQGALDEVVVIQRVLVEPGVVPPAELARHLLPVPLPLCLCFRLERVADLEVDRLPFLLLLLLRVRLSWRRHLPPLPLLLRLLLRLLMLLRLLDLPLWWLLHAPPLSSSSSSSRLGTTRRRGARVNQRRLPHLLTHLPLPRAPRPRPAPTVPRRPPKRLLVLVHLLAPEQGLDVSQHARADDCMHRHRHLAGRIPHLVHSQLVKVGLGWVGFDKWCGAGVGWGGWLV